MATRKKAVRRTTKRSTARSHKKIVNNDYRWTQRVTKESNALDLDAGVFNRSDSGSIARSLKRSAEKSQRRKSSPFRSAMSMLTFYQNRAGRTLSATQRNKLHAAKEELRRLYHR